MVNFKLSSLVRWLFPFALPRKNDAQKKDSVYIQDVNGKLWTTEEWDDSVKPNAIAVITHETKFLIALTQSPSKKTICNVSHAPLEEYMASHDRKEALADYDGAGNTMKIIMVEGSNVFAAGYCNSFTFPDGKTKGFLPSLGQLNLAYQNKAAVDAALTACGGTAMQTSDYYWSSTFWGPRDGRYRDFWYLFWRNGFPWHGVLNNRNNYVRPFADIS